MTQAQCCRSAYIERTKMEDRLDDNDFRIMREQIKQVRAENKRLRKACTTAHDTLLALHVCDIDKAWADSMRTDLKQALQEEKPK